MHVFNLTDLSIVYSQSSGSLWLEDGEGMRCRIARGYSGRGSARNDGTREKEIGWGPIPRGHWKLASPVDHPKLGPLSIPVSPVGGIRYGRTGFYIHGDNKAGNGTASTGCIIVGRAARETIRALSIRNLEVVE